MLLAGRSHTVASHANLTAVPGPAVFHFGACPWATRRDAHYRLEQGLARQPIAWTVQRGAYYFTNWEPALGTARGAGRVDSFYPPDFKLPMVAPHDLGVLAAERLLTGAAHGSITPVEGPRRYSPGDVARAFGRALGRPVEVRVIPRGDWPEALAQMGFSQAAAESFGRMTEHTLGGDFPSEDEVERGPTTLEQFVADLVRESAANPPPRPRQEG